MPGHGTRQPLPGGDTVSGRAINGGGTVAG